MEKDFDIEIQDSHDENEAHVQLPMNFLAFGEIEPDDVKVYICLLYTSPSPRD